MKNILLVGPGLIGKKHLEIVSQNPNSEIIGIVAPDHIENRVVAERYNCNFFTLLSDGLSVGPDGVIISSPNEFHFEQARECLLGGFPTLLEKPITTTKIDAYELCQLSQKTGVPLLIGHHRNHSSVLKKAKNIIEQNLLGSLVSFVGSAQFFKPDQYFAEGEWRTKIGGGPILINMIHEVGNMRFLCGEINRVQAFSSRKMRNFEVEDTASIIIEFQNGVLGTFQLSDTACSPMSWENTSGENKAYPQYNDAFCYIISGTMGSLQIPSLIRHYYSEGQQRSWWQRMNTEKYDINYEDPLVNQFNHFLDVISFAKSPIVSAEDGLANLLVIEAIQLSIQEQRPISISSLL